MRLALLAVVALLGCHEGAPKQNDDTGVGIGGTCPDGTEPVTTFVDGDGDGFGGEKTGNVSCADNIAAGNTAKSGDCDDENGGIFPGAVELCGDTDEDCDPSTEATNRTYYADTDGDNYGDPASSVSDCEAPTGYVLNNEDCNDADAAFNPDALEEDCNDPNDYNCDGSVDFIDNDGDGTAACADCDDDDASRAPTFGEVCDGVDNDCDTIIDPSTSLDAQTWYLDLDGDHYGDGDGTGIRTCDGPVGYAPNGDDCDDGNASINPDAAEVCDPNDVDEDCDGTVDDGDADVTDQPTWYRDADGDGYGDATQTVIACDAPAGYTDVVGDCDDADPLENGANAEICDGLDNDCDGQVDEGAAGGASAWYQDNDGDGYGNTGAAQYACTQPVGFVATGTDCDDTNANAYPGSVEVCGGGDEDCDGQVDESGAVNATSWYADVDGDGYGDPSTSTIACTQPFAYVSNSDDCNDRTATAYPGGTETCDAQNIDEDCNGLADDDDSNPANTSRFYYDVDYDGYGAGV
ncbi:MAG TPA: putative metal-binding motif-containing protein, partial [Myxococcota bacterium]|nr:putative metal-binding motif-containing protein [Myxococcota bacterium]